MTDEDEGIPMFPENEITRLTDNVFIHHPRDQFYQVWFHVGHQYFNVGIKRSSEAEARWYANVFIKVLAKFKELM